MSTTPYTNTWENFLRLCDRACIAVCGLSRDDLADCVDPGGYWDEGATLAEARESAKEFAQELITEEGGGGLFYDSEVVEGDDE